MTSFGERGNSPGQFRTVHAIASDKDGNLYVADRANRRIQVLDDEGHVKRIITIDIPADNSALEEFAAKWDGGGNPRAALGV